MRLAFGLAVAVCVLGVGAASASASYFESTGGATKGKSIAAAEKIYVWPMVVECTKATTKGSVPPGKFQTFRTEVKYSACTTFGTLKVTVSPGYFEYKANGATMKLTPSENILPEGTTTITAPITITPSLLKCHYEIPAQSTWTKAHVTYGTEDYLFNTKLPEGQWKLSSIFNELQGMQYTAHGWPCVGPTGSTKEAKEEIKEAEETGEEGKYIGETKEEVTNGQLNWIKQ